MWTIQTAESVLLTCWPPVPLERKVSFRISCLCSNICSSNEFSGITITPMVEVCMHLLFSVSGTRWTLITPEWVAHSLKVFGPIARKLIRFLFSPKNQILSLNFKRCINSFDSSPPTLTFICTRALGESVSRNSSFKTVSWKCSTRSTFSPSLSDYFSKSSSFLIFI